MEKLSFKKWANAGNSEVKGITLKRDGIRKLDISFQGNLDLYFSFYSNSFDNEDFAFLIGKDNYQVWEIFDKLYNMVVNANLFSFTEEDRDRIIFSSEVMDEDYHEKLREEEEKNRELNQILKENYEYNLLVNNGVITWRSDDYAKDIAPFFKIEKVGESYQISFGIPKIPDRRLDMEERDIIWSFKDLKNVSVRIRNSGSRYDPFNIAFMEAFNSLMNLESTNHQIHIEEYLIDKELEKGVSLERILRK